MPARDDAGLTLSSWALAPRQPDVQVVEYTVYTSSGDASWEMLTRSNVLVTDQKNDWSAALSLSPEQTDRLGESAMLFIKVRYGYFTLDDPTRMEDAVFPVERQFGPLRTKVEGAFDILPTIGG